MIERICNRCMESKPIDKFSGKRSRCNVCRAEANSLNVQHHRQLKEEVSENRAFNELMSQWIQF